MPILGRLRLDEPSSNLTDTLIYSRSYTAFILLVKKYYYNGIHSCSTRAGENMKEY